MAYKKHFQNYLLIPLSHKAVHKSSAFQVNYSKNLVYSNSKKYANAEDKERKKERKRVGERKREEQPTDSKRNNIERKL